MRLDKFLSDCGCGTRREARTLVRSGMVMVNGAAERNAGRQVDETLDAVVCAGRQLVYVKYQYLMMNKPAGVVTATVDKHLPTVLDLVPDVYSHYRIFPVGRLDIDTTGLLLLTNDGELAHRLLSPKNHVDKTYWAIIQGMVDVMDAEAFAAGIVLDDGYRCMPARLTILKSAAQSEISVTIQEGKYHQVKRMFASVGKKVVRLKRVQMGSLSLDEALPEGGVRPLTAEEVALLVKQSELCR